MIAAKSEHEADSQIWNIAGPGSGSGLQNFGTEVEQESEKVTLVSSEIYALCEIYDLSLFLSNFTSQNKEIKFGNYFFDV